MLKGWASSRPKAKFLQLLDRYVLRHVRDPYGLSQGQGHYIPHLSSLVTSSTPLNLLELPNSSLSRLHSNHHISLYWINDTHIDVPHNL